MIQSMKTYVYDRSKGLAKAAGFIGGAYLAQRYVVDRLEEWKVKLDQERAARESYVLFELFGTRHLKSKRMAVCRLRRRFQTAQEDVSYTILALLPTLAKQITEGMDVESLTQELQSRSKAHTAGLLRQRYNEHGLPQPNGAQPSRESGAVDEIQSEAGSTASASFIEAPSPSRGGESSGVDSWVETSGSGRSPRSLSPRNDTSSYHIPKLSDSVLTMNTTTTEGSVGNESRLVSLFLFIFNLVAMLLICCSRIVRLVCL